jgi:hypothetical protein
MVDPGTLPARRRGRGRESGPGDALRWLAAAGQGALAWAAGSSAAGSSQSSDSASAPIPFRKQVTGSYTGRLQGAHAAGSKDGAEDILEVVRVDEHAAGVRVHRESPRGHSADIAGVTVHFAQQHLLVVATYP